MELKGSPEMTEEQLMDEVAKEIGDLKNNLGRPHRLSIKTKRAAALFAAGLATFGAGTTMDAKRAEAFDFGPVIQNLLNQGVGVGTNAAITGINRAYANESMKAAQEAAKENADRAQAAANETKEQAQLQFIMARTANDIRFLENQDTIHHGLTPIQRQRLNQLYAKQQALDFLITSQYQSAKTNPENRR